MFRLNGESIHGKSIAHAGSIIPILRCRSTTAKPKKASPSARSVSGTYDGRAILGTKDLLNWLGSREQIVIPPESAGRQRFAKSRGKIAQLHSTHKKLCFIIIFPQSWQWKAPDMPRLFPRSSWNWKKSIVVIVSLKNDSRENNRNETAAGATVRPSVRGWLPPTNQWKAIVGFPLVGYFSR